jgi:hypothetical protein
MPTQQQKNGMTMGTLAFLAFVVIIILESNNGEGGPAPSESPSDSRPPAISHITTTPKR